ncbi:MAG: histidine phosphatase family protein [Candidatus Paceibacterota bacterium]
MRIIAVRHGETKYNKERKVMGSRIDAPLTKEGIREVQEALPKLKESNSTKIYSSPLLRTKETAEIIAHELSLLIEYRDELKERDVGTLSGEMYEKIAMITGYKDINSIEYDYSMYGGESSNDVQRRIQDFLNEVKKKHKNDPAIIVVTHSQIIRILYLLQNKSVTNNKVDNVCIHPFTID